MGKRIEIEGGEIAIRNSNGDFAIIPRHKRSAFMALYESDNFVAIDKMVSSLPRMVDYAADGAVMPNIYSGDPDRTLMAMYANRSSYLSGGVRVNNATVDRIPNFQGTTLMMSDNTYFSPDNAYDMAGASDEEISEVMKNNGVPQNAWGNDVGEKFDTRRERTVFSNNKERVENTYYGDRAVSRVRDLEGELSKAQEMVIFEEGFIDGKYKDTKGNVTYGVGQTGAYMDKSFKESYYEHEKRAEMLFKNFNDNKENIKGALMSAVYRGDAKSSYKWVKHFNNGDYKKAADEFIDSDDYRRSKKDSTGVYKRMDRVRAELLTLNKS